ncbi:MAG: cytochrome c [Nitrospinae bacterium]|nr:cytochrome c [Nitrospinota bacterium]
MKEMTLTQNITQKLLWGIPLSAIVLGLAAGVCFPYYFKLLFFWYCVAGILFFIVLDLPALKLTSSTKMVTLIKVVAIYVGAALFFTSWGFGLAQYQPENEVERINEKLDKYAKAEKEKKEAMTENAAIEMFKKKFYAKLEAFEEEEMDEDQIDQFSQVFESFLKPSRAVFVGDPIDKGKGKVDAFNKEVPPEIIEAGKKVYKDYECYNCHVDEEGRVTKRRGPNFTELKLGGKKTAEWMRMAILDPRAEMEDKYKNDPKLKKAMPADYRLQMFEEELIAVVGYMMTFK